MATTSLGLGISPLMLAPVTATWSAPFVAYLALLSNRVVYYRITEKTYMGDRCKSSSSASTTTPAPAPSGSAPESDPLFLATRSHANFLENVPLALTLSLLAELNGASRKVLHGALATLLVLRVAHVELGLQSSFRGMKSVGLGRALGLHDTSSLNSNNPRHCPTTPYPLTSISTSISSLSSPPTFSIPIASTAIMSNAPTLINLPPPPSDPVTPSDVPGTPNSTTTSMSELSTVAIKDGHRGHLPHHHQQHPLEAERADRISRLAGLERVGVAGGRPSNLNPSSAMGSGAIPSGPQTQGYFDANNQPQLVRERSTVGSASATGSVGGRTTWASGSDVGYDPSIADRMSEDQDMDTSSVGGFSDEGAPSLVGFGEGARTPARTASHLGSPVVGKASTSASASAVPPYLRDRPDSMQSSGGGGSVTGFQGNMSQGPPSPMTGVSGTDGPRSGASTPSTEAQVRDAQRIDGMTYDAGDTTGRAAPLEQSASAAHADRWLDRQAERERSERQQ
ncbi:MAPEG family-domain-containing protein [Phyllosticta paracitricarpa]